MAIRVTMTIGLRDDAGVVFGTLQKVSDRHLQAQSDAEYQQGQIVEFQFALEGRRTSVQGDAQIVRVSPHEMSHGPATYALKILTLAKGKEAVYREWLYELAHGGGSSARPHQDHASSISSTLSNAEQRRLEGERRLAALERAKSERRSRSVVSSIVGSSVSSARPGVGRQALRQALRGFAVRGGDVGSAGPDDRVQRALEVEPLVGGIPPRSVSPRSVSPRSMSPSSEPSITPSDYSSPGGRSDRPRRQRMEIRVRRDTDPSRVEVRFADARRYLAMYRDHLDRDVLFVRHDELDLPLGSPVRTRLVLPNDEVILCDASVGACLPSGTGLILSLDEGDRSLLRRTAAQLLRARK